MDLDTDAADCVSLRRTSNRSFYWRPWPVKSSTRVVRSKTERSIKSQSREVVVITRRWWSCPEQNRVTYTRPEAKVEAVPTPGSSQRNYFVGSGLRHPYCRRAAVGVNYHEHNNQPERVSAYIAVNSERCVFIIIRACD